LARTIFAKSLPRVAHTRNNVGRRRHCGGGHVCCKARLAMSIADFGAGDRKLPRAARVLVVEDEGIVARDLRRTLGGLGYEVVGTAATGEEALTAIAAFQPEVVLLDIHLKGPMDGIEVTAEMAKRDHTAIVVFLTAHADQATLARANGTRAYGYLLKPYKEREIKATIDLALRRAAEDRSSRARETAFAGMLKSFGDLADQDAEVVGVGIEDSGRIAFERGADGELRGLRAALESAVDCFARIDVDGRFVYMNSAFARTYGQVPEQLLGRSWLLAIHPAERSAMQALSGKMPEGRLETETLGVRKDGSSFPARVTMVAARTSQGLPAGHFCFIKDISELRTVEERLLAANAALEESRAALQELAIRDELTGLYNRREFGRALAQEVARTTRTARPLSLLVLDIDHFKAVNDRHGHEAGDRVLQGVARVVMESVRSLDRAARFGGEELVVLLPETPASEALCVAERLRRRIAAARFGSAVTGADLGVTVSIGVATYPVDCAGADELFCAADRALYDAKRSGRNRCVPAGCAPLPLVSKGLARGRARASVERRARRTA